MMGMFVEEAGYGLIERLRLVIGCLMGLMIGMFVEYTGYGLIDRLFRRLVVGCLRGSTRRLMMGIFVEAGYGLRGA